MALRLRRGTDAERLLITPLQGELIFATDTKELYVGDGATVGGVLVGPISTSLSNDTSPQLSGDLDLNGNNIVGIGSINIDGTITATGSIGLGDADADTITVSGVINSSLRPALDKTYDLGTPSRNWREIFASGATFDGEVYAESLRVGNIVANDSTVLYNSTTRILSSDIKGSIFADDSTVLVDAINSRFFGTFDTGDLVLNPTTITSNSSNFDIGTEADPLNLTLNLATNLQIHQLHNPSSPKGYITTTISRGTLDNPTALQAGDELGGVVMRGYTDSSTPGIAGVLSFFVDPTASIVAGGNYLKTIVALSASSDTTQNESDAFLLNSAGEATSNAFIASKYLKLPVYADDSERDAAITSPEAGMMVFVQSGTTPAATNQMQVFDGSDWVNAS